MENPPSVRHQITDSGLRQDSRAIQFRTPVLLEISENWILFLSRSWQNKSSNCSLHQKSDTYLSRYSPYFRFYITTNWNPHYLPWTLYKVTLVNFMTPGRDSKTNYLGVAAKERPELEEEKKWACCFKHIIKKTAQKSQDQILEILSKSRNFWRMSLRSSISSYLLSWTADDIIH
jgi:hypothetical protein